MSVAPTVAEARARALPQARMMARLRSGKPLGPQETVEDAASTPLDGLTSQMADEMLDRWIVDEPEAAARRVRELAARHAVDEVMVVPVAASRADEPLGATPVARRRSSCSRPRSRADARPVTRPSDDRTRPPAGAAPSGVPVRVTGRPRCCSPRTPAP
ncbi:hypothetical protein NKG05_08955 [Oerskovia sp. M15]